MTLSPFEFGELWRAADYWADNVPNEPAVGFLQTGELLTPRQLVDALDDRGNPDGAAFLEMLEHAVRHDGLEMVTRRFYTTVDRYRRDRG